MRASGETATRGAVVGVRGTNTKVVLVLAMVVVGVAVVGAAVVGAAVVGGAVVGAAAVGGAVLAVVGGLEVAIVEGAPGRVGVSGTNGIVPVGRPGVVDGKVVDGQGVAGSVVVGGLDAGTRVAPAGGGGGTKPGAGITRPSGGTTSSGRVGTWVVVEPLSERDFLALLVGTVVVERAAEVVAGALVAGMTAGFEAVGGGAVATIPSGGTTGNASDSRKRGSGRARGTVAVEAYPSTGFCGPSWVSCGDGSSEIRTGPATRSASVSVSSPSVSCGPAPRCHEVFLVAGDRTARVSRGTCRAAASRSSVRGTAVKKAASDPKANAATTPPTHDAETNNGRVR